MFFTVRLEGKFTNILGTIRSYKECAFQKVFEKELFHEHS